MSVSEFHALRSCLFLIYVWNMMKNILFCYSKISLHQPKIKKNCRFHIPTRKNASSNTNKKEILLLGR